MTDTDGPVVALSSDLMDRSRLSVALTGLAFVTDPESCRGAHVVIVDLARFADSVGAVRASSPDARIVAFGSHVDREAIARAARDGADVVLPRSQFFRDPAAAIRA